ncbi:MAG: hypothetical protein R3183_07500 [Oleiphilaceae bacterium]|nr:hypothetical protein [Oleiphilaceae bacterium]
MLHPGMIVSRLAMCLLFTLLLKPVSEACAENAEKDVFAHVNGQVLPIELLRFLKGSRLRYLGGDQQDLASSAAYDLLVTEVFAQQAQQLGIDHRLDFVVEMEMARKTLLAQLYVQHFLNNTSIPDEAIAQRYATLTDTELYRFRVLSLSSHAEAEQLLHEFTKEPVNEGALRELGFIDGPWLSRSDLPENISSIVSQLAQNGFHHRPVESADGWQLVQLIGKQTFPKPAFESQAPVLESELRSELLNEHVSRALGAADIKIVNDLGSGVKHALAQ